MSERETRRVDPLQETEVEFHDRLVEHIFDTAILWAKDRWPAASRVVHREVAIRATKAALLRMEIA